MVWEAAIIRQLLYDAGAVSSKFVPVLFADGSPEHIPTPVRGWSRYVVDTEDGYDGLYRCLTGQPHLPRPVLGTIRKLPTRDRRWSERTRQAVSSSLNLREPPEGRGLMEPVTTGILVAGALSMAADAALKGAVGEVVKDAYKAIKEKVSQWAAGEVAALEATPQSVERQTVVAEIIDAQPEDDREALCVLAKTLVARLKERAPAIGLDIGRLTALEAELGNITVRSGIGARIEEANVGTFKTGDISVGDPPGK